ncbi:hypothetical protein BGX33_011371, partial [Mortierella sp. NVP41]
RQKLQRCACTYSGAQSMKRRPVKEINHRSLPSPSTIPNHRLPARFHNDDDEEQPLTSTDLLPKEGIEMAVHIDDIMDDLATVISGLQAYP